MTTTEGFVRADSDAEDRESPVSKAVLLASEVYPFVPLPPDPVIIVIPDTPEGLCEPPAVLPAEPVEPVTVAAPAPVAVPQPVEGPVPVAVPAAERVDFLGSNCFWFSLVAVKYACCAGIAWLIWSNILYPAYGFLSWVASFTGAVVVAGGALAVTAAAVAVVWRLVGSVAAAPVSLAAAPVSVTSKVVRLVVTGKEVAVKTKVKTKVKAKAKAKAKAQSPAPDGLTARWCAMMRDPSSQQAYGTVVGDDLSGGHGARCAGGWGLEAVGGINKRSMRTMERQYGLPLLRKIARMNDKGVPLSKIADYVERTAR